MNPKLLTRLFILAWVIAPLAWTGYMVSVHPDATISEQITWLATETGPKGLMIPVLWGLVTGHLFFSMGGKCKKCGEKA